MFQVSEITQASGSTTRRTAKQNQASMDAFLTDVVWFQTISFPVGSLIQAIQSLLDGSPVEIAGTPLAGIGELRCIACQGMHGAPSQGFRPTAPFAEWSTNKQTIGKARLFLVTFRDGSRKIAYLSDTCYSEHLLGSEVFKTFKLAQKSGKTLKSILETPVAPVKAKK
ncbi:MAG: hypothetical protein MN733_28865 [Nitrososphaera sp.]|nr:hypothetical protein [Nitrososphaera sp.]